MDFIDAVSDKRRETEQQTNGRMRAGAKDEKMDDGTCDNSQADMEEARGGARRLTEGSARSHTPSIPSSLLPSVVLLQTQRWRDEGSCCRHGGAAATALIQVHPSTPPSSPPFLCPVIHSWSNHTHTHTLSHTSHTSYSHTHILKNGRHKKREAETTAT